MPKLESLRKILVKSSAKFFSVYCFFNLFLKEFCLELPLRIDFLFRELGVFLPDLSFSEFPPFTRSSWFFSRGNLSSSYLLKLLLFPTLVNLFCSKIPSSTVSHNFFSNWYFFILIFSSNGSFYLTKKIMTHLFPMHPFSNPWKHQKT